MGRPSRGAGASIAGVRPFVSAALLVFAIAPAACSRERAAPPVVVIAPAVPAALPLPERDDPVEDALQAARATLAGGDDAKAMFAFDQLIAALPEGERRDAVRCELAVVLNNRALRAAGADLASDPRSTDLDTRRAVELCPENARLARSRARWLVARAAAEPRGEHEARARALPWLAQSIALNDDDADAHLLAGELLLLEEDVPSTLVHLRRAAALRPDDERLASRLADLEGKASVEGSFRDNRREHFIARFEGFAHEQLSWTALAHLEKAYFAVGAKLNLFPKEPITVVIYTGEQYRQVTDVPDWAAGSFDGKIRVREGSLTLQQGELENLLRHEYTHAALATLPAPLPTWINEGLAQYLAGEDRGHRERDCRRAKASGGLLSYQELSGSFVKIIEAERARLAYAMAFLLVQDLVERRGEYALQTLTSRLARGEPFDDAFTATYAMTPGKAYTALVDAL